MGNYNKYIVYLHTYAVRTLEHDLMIRRHNQTLFPLEEQLHNEPDEEEEDDEAWDTVESRTYPSPPPVTTSLNINTSRTTRSIKSRSSTLYGPQAPNAGASQYSKLYSQFVRRYRSTGLGDTTEPDDPQIGRAHV